MKDQITISDLEIILKNLNILIHEYAGEAGSVRYAHCMTREAESEYAARIFKEKHHNLLNTFDKLNDILIHLKRESSADKPLNVTIKEPTSRYKVQIKSFERVSELNIFLNDKNIEYVDLKINASGYYYLSYRSVAIDD